MKKLTLLAIVTIAFTFNSFAQISAGGGISYGTEIETIGFNLRGQYSITESIDVVGGFTFFIPNKTSQSIPFFGTIETKSTLWTFDIDGHYNFSINDKFGFYPLGGLNISGASVDIDGTKASDTEVGLNIGAGATYNINDKLAAFTEIKYTIGNMDQAVIGIGVLYAF
jgi:opacity protein-like surface antigen